MTVTNWIVAIVAVLALLLSIYNTYTQRRYRHPRLKVTGDTRLLQELGEIVFSCRVVNEGTMPASIGAVRIFYGGSFTGRFGKGPRLAFPDDSDALDPHLMRNEVRFPYESEESDAEILPRTLQPTESVRFVVSANRLSYVLGGVGLRRLAEFRVGVVDHRDKWHMSRAQTALVFEPPEQPLP